MSAHPIDDIHERPKGPIVSPERPSALQSITLRPLSNEHFSTFRQQRIKRSLIGRVLVARQTNEDSSIVLDADEYDFTTKVTHNHSFVVTAVTFTSQSVCGIILPSTNITFAPEKSSEIVDEPCTSRTAQTLIDTIKSLVFVSKDEKISANRFVDISRAVILSGNPGAGKTFAIRMAVKSLKQVTRLIPIRGSDILASIEPSKALIRVFHSALRYCHKNQNSIAVIFMDECDALVSSDHLAHLLGAILDRMSDRAWRRIIVIAATNKVDSIPSQLRRPGRFDHEIGIKPPDSKARLAILQSILAPYKACNQISNASSFDRASKVVETKNTDQANKSIEGILHACDDSVGLYKIAESCVGYVPADLDSLVRKAAQLATECHSEILQISHLDRAMRQTGASALRTSAVPTISKHSWVDIVGDPGGAKTALIHAVEWPRTKKKIFANLGLVPPRGILLYGPPGCAKTSLARAAAGATGVAFFSLSPADVYSSSYVGDAEAVIRRTFSLARSASPCILFFDEIDAIIGSSSSFSGEGDGLDTLRRGRADGGTDAEIRVLSTFLNEMDGIDGSADDGVLIFAATNRPHTLDAALLRPGRFDKVIHVPPPDQVGRRMIFESQCKWVKHNQLDLDFLASDDMSAHMTGAELVGVCREAAMMAIRDALTNEKEALEPILQQRHLQKAIQNIKPLLADPHFALQFRRFHQ